MKSLANPSLAATVALLLVSCSSNLPEGNEKNIAFGLDRNQLVLEQIMIEGHRGRFVAGSANRETLVDTRFASAHGLDRRQPATVMIGSTWLDETRIQIVDMGGEIDAIVGSDLLGPVVAIDFRNRLLTRFTHLPEDLDRSGMYRWRDVPSYPIMIDGTLRLGVIDAASPDTLVVPASLLPGRDCRRCVVDVEIGGIRFDDLDIMRADVERISIGNRVLQHFLTVIDYRGQTAALLQP